MKFIIGFGSRESSCGKAHSWMRPRRQVQPRESRTAQYPAIERADRINAHTIQALRLHLINGDNPWIDLHHLQQVIFVADARQAVFFFVGGKSREKIDSRFIQTQKIAPGIFRQGSVLNEVTEIARAITVAAAWPAGNKLVGAKCLLVKKVS